MGALVALLIVCSAPVWADPALDGQLPPAQPVATAAGCDFVEVVIPARRILVSEVFKPHALTSEQQAAVDRFLRDHRVTGENEKALRSAFPWMLGLGFVHLPLNESLSHYFAVEQIVENSVVKMDKLVMIPECRVRVPRQSLPTLPAPVTVETPKLVLELGKPTSGIEIEPIRLQVRHPRLELAPVQQTTACMSLRQQQPVAITRGQLVPERLPAGPTVTQSNSGVNIGVTGVFGYRSPSASSSSSSNSSASASSSSSSNSSAINVQPPPPPPPPATGESCPPLEEAGVPTQVDPVTGDLHPAAPTPQQAGG